MYTEGQLLIAVGEREKINNIYTQSYRRQRKKQEAKVGRLIPESIISKNQCDT